MLKDIYRKFKDSGAERTEFSLRKEVQNDLLSFKMCFDDEGSGRYNVWFVIRKESLDIELSAIAKCISVIFKQEYFYYDLYPHNLLIISFHKSHITDEHTEEVEIIANWVNLFAENEDSLYEFLSIVSECVSYEY